MLKILLIAVVLLSVSCESKPASKNDDQYPGVEISELGYIGYTGRVHRIIDARTGIVCYTISDGISCLYHDRK